MNGYGVTVGPTGIPARRSRWWVPSILSRGGSVWRAVVLGGVCFATVFWANVAFAQIGVDREEDRWYYCYISRFNPENTNNTVPWSAPECLQLLFEPKPGGGGFESVLMVGEALSEKGGSGMGTYAAVRGYVLPPRGVERWDYVCDVWSHKERAIGIGIMGGSTVFGMNGTVNDHGGTGFAYSVDTPAAGSPNTGVLNTVGHVSGKVFDTFWEDETWSSNDDVEPGIYGVYFSASALTSYPNSKSWQGFECQITSWESWPQWLDDNPEWVPGGDDLAVPPILPIVPFTGVTPLAPVSNTIEFEIGVPGTPECTVIVPNGGISETVFGYEIDAGWADYEVCTQPVSMQVEILEFDIVGYVLLAVGVLSVGAIYKFFRTG